MSFSVEVSPEVTNIISIDTSFADTIETVIEEPITDTKTLEINNNNYNDDFTYTKNIVDIETTNAQ